MLDAMNLKPAVYLSELAKEVFLTQKRWPMKRYNNGYSNNFEEKRALLTKKHQILFGDAPPIVQHNIT